MDNINAQRPLTTFTVSQLMDRSQILMKREKINQVKVEDKVQDKEEILEEDDDEKEAPGVGRQELITD